MAAAARSAAGSRAGHPERVLHPAGPRRRLLADPARPRMRSRPDPGTRLRRRRVHGRRARRCRRHLGGRRARSGHGTDRATAAPFRPDHQRADAERGAARAQHGRGHRQRAVRRDAGLRPDRAEGSHQEPAQLLHLAVGPVAAARRRRGPDHLQVHHGRPRKRSPRGDRSRGGPARRYPPPQRRPVSRRHRGRHRHRRVPQARRRRQASGPGLDRDRAAARGVRGRPVGVRRPRQPVVRDASRRGARRAPPRLRGPVRPHRTRRPAGRRRAARRRARRRNQRPDLQRSGP